MTTYIVVCPHIAPLSCPDCGAEPGSPYCTADSLLDAEAFAHLVSA